MSPAAPQFMFDSGSPNAFLSHEAIPAIEKRTGAKFEYVPILLGGIFKATDDESPADARGVKNKRESTRWKPSASSSASTSSPTSGIRSFRSTPSI